MNPTSAENRPLPFSAAAERNRSAILAVLQEYLPANARVLEIGAGTGQHAVAFSGSLPGVSWLPTDCGDALPGLRARIEAEGGGGLDRPVALDVAHGPWPPGPFDAVFTANTCHIMAWESVCAMLIGAADRLWPGGLMFVYGPFRIRGGWRSEGDRRFDQSLRRQNPHQGIRDLEDLEKTAARAHLKVLARIDMPANNLTVILRKSDDAA